MLAHSQALSKNQPTGFLVGLFSMLDALLDQTMDQVVEKLPLSPELKSALCGEESRLKQYLSLIKAYEVGHWKTIRHLCTALQLDENLAQSFYHEAIKWGSAMKQITTSK
jgi:EAL and modified HD-GYP domain-containing signal transduction protein